MIETDNQEIVNVVAKVSKWPIATRVKLARKILETVESSNEPKSSRGYTADEVIALLKMPQPAPNDAECERILMDELLTKYAR